MEVLVFSSSTLYETHQNCINVVYDGVDHVTVAASWAGEIVTEALADDEDETVTGEYDGGVKEGKDDEFHEHDDDKGEDLVIFYISISKNWLYSCPLPARVC